MKISNSTKIVCLGGGVGTSTLLKGIKKFDPQLTIITSMADDGGSSGRLRKAYKIMPPGDIVNTISALISDEQKELSELLSYRFPGINRDNKAVDGHKLGNLIMLAEMQRTGDFYKAIEVTKKMFGVTANFLPATDQRVHLSAITKDGRRVHSETTLDLALYSEPYGLKKVYLTPAKPRVNPQVTKRLMEADMIISGPGDLYTNQLPVLIVTEIKEAIIKSPAKKIFILNIANKPFETKGFTLLDFIKAFEVHLGSFPFDTILMNDNFSIPIPKKYKYKYIKTGNDKNSIRLPKIIQSDFVDESFPLYHDHTKLARAIVTLYNSDERG